MIVLARLQNTLVLRRCNVIGTKITSTTIDESQRILMENKQQTSNG